MTLQTTEQPLRAKQPQIIELILCNYLCYKILIILHIFYILIANVTLLNYVLSFFKMRHYFTDTIYVKQKHCTEQCTHCERDFIAFCTSGKNYSITVMSLFSFTLFLNK